MTLKEVYDSVLLNIYNNAIEPLRLWVKMNLKMR